MATTAGGRAVFEGSPRLLRGAARESLRRRRRSKETSAGLPNSNWRAGLELEVEASCTKPRPVWSRGTGDTEGGGVKKSVNQQKGGPRHLSKLVEGGGVGKGGWSGEIGQSGEGRVDHSKLVEWQINDSIRGRRFVNANSVEAGDTGCAAPAQHAPAAAAATEIGRTQRRRRPSPRQPTWALFRL